MQAPRQDLLKQAAEKGVVEGCTGKRRTLKGKEFEFFNGTLFNVEGADGGLAWAGHHVGHSEMPASCSGLGLMMVMACSAAVASRAGAGSVPRLH